MRKEISPILQSKHNLKAKPQNVIYLPTYTRFMIFDNLKFYNHFVTKMTSKF